MRNEQKSIKTKATAAKKVEENPQQQKAIDGQVDDAIAPFVGALFRAIAGVDDRQIVIVCFGTTAISGDSLGPTVGSLLRDKYKVSAFVYGTDGHCVNGKNMGEWMEFIKSVHGDALYIAIDASLGAGEKIGQIILRPDGVCPAAIKGKTNRFGDVGILGVVAKNTSDPLMQLMTVSKLYVDKMADKIANMLYCALI
ncbi:MAG: spore protease YyaC [Bacteroides sp.]|nr:spore protease YyaC [Bacillota bacterium]MCM1393718.1 spore protease YyaC [[Eubacterium] siraeum]MCM1455236.1 spore protease YyaC [Bacteroides sp.]